MTPMLRKCAKQPGSALWRIWTELSNRNVSVRGWRPPRGARACGSPPAILRCRRPTCSSSWRTTRPIHSMPPSSRRSRRRMVRVAAERLSPRCQRLLGVLMSDDDLPYKTIAEQLSMPIGSIGPTRGRCLEHLRADNGGHGTEPGVRPQLGGQAKISGELLLPIRCVCGRRRGTARPAGELRTVCSD